MEFTLRGDEPLPVDVQVAGSELERIRLEHHHLTPALVVDESRPEEAPLHPVFEWRDPVAAEQWREHQAASLMRRVRVVTPKSTEVQDLARAVAMQPTPVAPIASPIFERANPMAKQMTETVGLLVETCRRLEELHAYACRRMDRKLSIALQVALDEVRDAHEVLSGQAVESTLPAAV